jgi:hypothetical protein
MLQLLLNFAGEHYILFGICFLGLLAFMDSVVTNIIKGVIVITSKGNVVEIKSDEDKDDSE